MTMCLSRSLRNLLECLCIDHVVVSDDSVVTNLKVDHIHTISDHGVVSGQFDVCGFLDTLNSIDWGLLYVSASTDNKIFFYCKLLETLDMHAPVLLSKVTKPMAPCLTENLIFMSNRALTRFKRTKRIEHWAYHKQLRNLVNKAVIRKKRGYLQHNIVAADMKRIIFKELRTLGCNAGQAGAASLPQHI